MTYDSASMDSSNFPPFTNPTGSGDVNASMSNHSPMELLTLSFILMIELGTWEDKVVLLYPYSAGMIHCQQVSSYFNSSPNCAFNVQKHP